MNLVNIEKGLMSRKAVDILIIVGKTASGKDTIVKKLVSDYEFRKIITYTTRPIRKNEKQNEDYHFISEEEFKEKIKKGFFAEWKSYNTEFGAWYYGTAFKDLENADEKTVIILTPEGFKDIIGKMNSDIVSIYIYSNNKTIKDRLIMRNDDVKEAERRIHADNQDFKGIENDVNKIFYNNKGTNIGDITENIVMYLNLRDLHKEKR